MQRAAMSKSSQSPKQPSSVPSSKRRRIDSESRNSTPQRSGDSTPLSHFATRVAEERAQSISTLAREGEDTEWVLDISLPNGHADESDSEEDIWSSKATGRQTYGAFKRNKATTVKPKKDDADADLSSASDGEVSDSPPSQPKSATDRFSKQNQRQVSDTASPLRQHAQRQDRKRKLHPTPAKGGKKSRKTM